MTALLDTCVIIDALANREPFYREAQELLLRGSEAKVALFISAKSLLDLHYVLKHYLHEESVVRSKLADLLQSVSVVDTKGVSCSVALASPTTDYEDAVQTETALIEGVDCIITRDASGFSLSPVPVKDPHAFLVELDGGESL